MTLAAFARRRFPAFLFILVPCLLAGRAVAIEPVPFTQETLPNGLRVIYSPLHQAPVVEVRVLYHVGSRDERPDRQGFAHMFEHMMFRGSAHVPPEEHMKLVGIVGGMSNAFTSFDQTVYHQTLPSNQLELALWLEADRMSSFKVSADIFKTERKVVAEEWRIGQNKPYGTMYQDFLGLSFQKSPYHWTPIGNMDHLRAAQVSELQDFFNTYYLPNNAVLVVAGDIEVPAAQKLVQKYFGWIPRGPDVKREIPVEPAQTDPRQTTVPQRVPLAAIMIGYHTPPYASDDHYPLDLLGTILGGGRSSRLERLLVNSEQPSCVNASAGDMNLEDQGIFMVNAHVMNGKDAKDVEKELAAAVAEVVRNGVTADELDKAKTEARVSVIKARETAELLAGQLGEAALFANDPNRVNTELDKLEAVTAADVQAVARKYLNPTQGTTLYVKPDPLGKDARAAATQAAAVKDAPVAPSTRAVTGRDVVFPDGYQSTPPVHEAGVTPKFQKGDEFTVEGVKVIVMTDHRLPTVNWSLMMRRGSHSDPAGKEGIGPFTANLLRRGTQQMTGIQLSEDLESRGIALTISDSGDHTRLNGDCTTDQLEHGIQRSREVLLTPKFDPEEFKNLKEQTLSMLLQAQETPSSVAANDMANALYGGTLMGRYQTPASVKAITLDDVKQFYDTYYRLADAVLIFSGDVTSERGKEMAARLLGGWKSAQVPEADYTKPFPPIKRKIILVDRPDAKGSSVRLGIRTYDIHTDEKYAGSLTGQILSAGIESRLMKYVRAEKGLAYGCYGYFMPGRHSGQFVVMTDTDPERTADAIEAIFKVLTDVRTTNVTGQELSEAKLRVAGGMVMGMQTIQQQAGTRIEGILNDYPLDYYDQYAGKIAAVTADQIREVMNKYVKLDDMTIVVVAPAAGLKEKLSKFGEVEVRPMPALRSGGVGGPGAPELLKPDKVSSAMPAAAVLAVEGPGKITYAADMDGQAYVFDATTSRIVFSAAMTRGQKLIVDPEQGSVSVDGKIVLDHGLQKGSSHRVYLGGGK